MGNTLFAAVRHERWPSGIGASAVFIDGRWRDCTAEYDAWKRARFRCESEQDRDYPNYGGRGIQFRFSSFEQFIDHIGLKPNPKLSLDRVNNDGHYELGNVRWATKQQQVRNQRCDNCTAIRQKRLEEFSDKDILMEILRRKRAQAR